MKGIKTYYIKQMLPKFSFGDIIYIWKKVIHRNISEYILSLSSAYHEIYKITILLYGDLSILIFVDPLVIPTSAECNNRNKQCRRFTYLCNLNRLPFCQRRMLLIVQRHCESVYRGHNYSERETQNKTFLPNVCLEICGLIGWNGTCLTIIPEDVSVPVVQCILFSNKVIVFPTQKDSTVMFNCSLSGWLLASGSFMTHGAGTLSAPLSSSCLLSWRWLKQVTLMQQWWWFHSAYRSE